MIFHANDSALAKRVAKSLKKELDDLVVPTTLGECQNVVARMYGFANWHEMEADLGRHVPSPDDGAASVEEVAIRRLRHVAVLTAAFPRLEGAAPRVVDAIAPTAWRPKLAPTPQVRSVVLHVVADGEYPGAALSWTSEEGPRTSGLAIWKGNLWAYSIHAHFAETSGLCAALAEPESEGQSRRRAAVHDNLDYAFLAFGLRAHPDWQDDPVAAVGASAEASGARDAIRGVADREALAILASTTSRMTVTRHYAFYAEKGSMRVRRHAFAARYPEFAIHGIGDRDVDSLIDRQADPDDAMLEVLRRQMWARGDGDMAKAAFARLREAKWDLDYVEQLGCLGGVLARIPQAEIPRTPREREALIELCWHLEHAVEKQVPRGNEYAAGLAMTIAGKNWSAKLAKWNFEGKAGVERLAKSGIDLREEDDVPQDPIDRFYANLDHIMSVVMYEAVMPTLARTNETIRHLYLNPKMGGNVGKNHAWLLPPMAFENSCAPLFLDGISHCEFVTLMESSHLVDRANGYVSLPAIEDLDPDKISARLDTYRHLLRPAHRGMAAETVAAASLAGLREAGREIADPSMIRTEDEQRRAFRR